MQNIASENRQASDVPIENEENAGKSSGDRKRRRLKDILQENPELDPFPEGWFILEFSKNIKSDKLISKKFVGNDVVIYRDPQSGEVVVVQAHCPHMGGHFDSYKNGGCVKNGVITCPYHHLEFNARGDCITTDWEPKSLMERLKLKTYQAVEYRGFVLAAHQRNPNAAPLPAPNLDFEGVDHDKYLYDVQSVGVFEGDSLIPLMANADYMHFYSVHGTSVVQSDNEFTISDDGNECYFSFLIDSRLRNADPEYPRSGRFKRLRRWITRPSLLREPGILTVDAMAVGAGLVKSRWDEPAHGIDMLSWLYVTPITPYKYELFMCHGVRTIKQFKSKKIQWVMNYLALQAHMMANHLFVGQEDPPFYTAAKLRLSRPAYRKDDAIVARYIRWWKETFFSKEFLEATRKYDLDFS